MLTAPAKSLKMYVNWIWNSKLSANAVQIWSGMTYPAALIFCVAIDNVYHVGFPKYACTLLTEHVQYVINLFISDIGSYAYDANYRGLTISNPWELLSNADVYDGEYYTKFSGCRSSRDVWLKFAFPLYGIPFVRIAISQKGKQKRSWIAGFN